MILREGSLPRVLKWLLTSETRKAAGRVATPEGVTARRIERHAFWVDLFFWKSLGGNGQPSAPAETVLQERQALVALRLASLLGFLTDLPGGGGRRSHGDRRDRRGG